MRKLFIHFWHNIWLHVHLLSYETDDVSAEIALPENFLIELKDENIKTLKSTFGKENINLVYHSRPHLN